MIERVEILEGGRKELRRGVGLSCEVVSDFWDEDVPFRMLDLSPSGAFVETSLPLGPDDELELKFTPPRSRALYFLRARVVRTSLGRRGAKSDVPGMGIEFLDLTAGDRDALAGYLVGIPPRVPVRGRGRMLRPNASIKTIGAEDVWVEEITDPGSSLEIDGFVPRALSSLLTTGVAARS